MKITRVPIRKPLPLPQELTITVEHLINDEQDQIKNWTNIVWNYPRGDLFQFVTVLNRFDAILETTCKEYELEKSIQMKQFNNDTKQLLLSILQFSKMLFENCTNRNIYNSYEYLNNLLNTTDVDILEAVLQFMMKPAQRVNNPRAVPSSFFLAHQDKITELARSGSILDLTNDAVINNKLSMSFYRIDGGTEEGLQVINIVTIPDQQTDHDLFWKLVEENQIPKEYHFELLNRIRIANHSSNASVKKQLLIIRFISIVIMAHTMSETIAQNRIFIYEPHLVSQIASLVSYNNQIPVAIQTYALYALDGIARHRTKVTEILTAFNASANHGILLHTLRQLYQNNLDYTPEFIDALFTLLSLLIQTAAGGTMLMSAGIMSTLIQVMDHPENNEPLYKKALLKVVGLLDSIIHYIEGSFSSFCSAHGLDILLKLIQAQVDICINQYSDNKSINHDSILLVKNSFRFLIRMLESSATADGLRNLVESSVPHTIKKVLEHNQVFGASIFALVINVTTTFIHTEPTSLSVLQEIMLPQTILKAFNTYESSTFEVLMAILDSFGAICLNSTGLDMFKESNPLPHFFKLMTSPNFVTNTSEIGNETALGTTMDELIRHQPSLKMDIYKFANDLLLQVTEIGKSIESKPVDDCHMLAIEQKATEPSSERADCLLLAHVDLVAKFLEGFLRNSNSTKEFTKYEGLELLLRYYDLPYLPYNYSVSNAFTDLSYVFREVSKLSPIRFANIIIKKVYEASRFIFTDFDHNKSILYDYIDLKDKSKETIRKGNELFHKLSVLFGYIGLLSTVFASSILTNSKQASKLVEWAVKPNDEYGSVIVMLGDIHRTLVWQNILFRESVPKSWYKKNEAQSSSEDDVDLNDPRVINTRRFKLLLSEIPPAIMPILQGFIKASVSRRPVLLPEILVSKRSKLVARHISILFRNSLEYISEDAPVCKYDYYASMFSMISMLLLDDHSRAALQTPIAMAFEDIGIIDFLIDDLFPIFWNIAEEEIKANSLDDTLIQRINTCIELLLAIFHHLGSSKLFHNSPHTVLLTFPYPEDYSVTKVLNPYHWMASMQLKISKLYKYLESSVLPKFSRHVLHSLLRCITQSLRAEGERSRRIRNLSNSNIPNYETNRRVLISMGFDTEQVDVALRDFRYGICALDNLFSRRLIGHTIESGPPQLEISPDLESSNPLTVVEYEAALRILVNMWYDPTLAEEALSENNNLAQAAMSLSHYNPSAIRVPQQNQDTDQHTMAENSDSDNQYEDIESDEEEEENDEMMDDDSDDEYEDIEDDEEDDMIPKPIFEKEVYFSAENDSREAVDVRNQLSELRSKMRSTVPSILAHLVDERNDLDFEVRDLMAISCCGDPEHFEKNSMQAIQLFFGGIRKVPDKRSLFESSVNKIRIFALMLREPVMQDVMSLLIKLMSDIMDWFDFLDLVVTHPNFPDPKWLTTLFLILEASLAQSDEPKEEAAPTLNNDTVSTTDVHKDSDTPAIVTNENRSTLMKYCVNLLKMKTLSSDNVIATLRIIVRLTKHHESAKQFVELGGLEPLFMRPSTTFDIFKVQQTYVIMILRHIIECKPILIDCMNEWFSFWFTVPSAQFLDIPTYIRNNSSLALRDPEAFIDISLQLCRLSGYSRGNLKSIRYIGDLVENNTIQNNQQNTGQDSIPVTIGENENNEKENYSHMVISFLLNQLITTQENNETSNIKMAYTGFLLQCMFELVSSYPACKYEIIDFGLHNTLNVQSNHTKVRESILYKLIDKYLSYNATNTSTDVERIKQGVSMWLTSLLIGLCYETNNTKSKKKTTHQDEKLAIIRNHLIDVIYRSFKDELQSDNPASIKYNRYFALAELCHRILNARPMSILPGLNIREDNVIAVAKLMLERNFVPVFISAISDIDVNFPYAKLILNSIMRPLEQLTKFANKIDNLDLAEDKNHKQKSLISTDETADDEGADDEESNHDVYIPMDTDEDEAAENEVNDMYRNSSLAMFDGTVMEEAEDESEDDAEMASSGDEIVETSDENSEEFGTDNDTGIEDMGEDQEMDDLMRSHRYHHSDTDDEDDESGSEDSDSDSELGTSDESGMSYTDSEYESTGDSLDSDASDAENLENNREESWDINEVAEEVQQNDRHRNRRRNRQVIQAEIVSDEEGEEMNTEPSDLDDDEMSDELDQEELEDVERNRALFHGGIGRDPTHLFNLSRRYRNNNINDSIGNSQALDRNNIILHPLLRSSNVEINSPVESSAAPDTAILSGANSNHLQAYEDIIGGSAVRILEDLLNQQQRRNSNVQPAENSNEPSSTSNKVNESNKEAKETLSILKDFQPMQTSDRWLQETQMVYIPSVASTKAAKLTNTLTARLIEIAKKDADNGQEIKEATDAEEDRNDVITIDLNSDGEAIDVILDEDSSNEGSSNSYSEEEYNTASDEEGFGYEDNDITYVDEDDAQGQENEERVTVMINGEEIDITGLGIDVEFLEALPDDLRAEVLTQQMAERRPAFQNIETDEISPEFLAALPDSIRDEILEQESYDRQRRQNRNNQNGQANEQSSQDDQFDQRDEHIPQTDSIRGINISSADMIDSWGVSNDTNEDQEQPKNIKASRQALIHRDSVRIIDKYQLATLARLLFVPQSISKALLNRLLLNLCENSKTRIDLLSLLISILQDGCKDLAAVDRYLTQLNLQKGKQALVRSEESKSTKINPLMANVPNLITQRCLEILYYVVNWNDRSLAYFLTENNSLGLMRRRHSVNGRKSKSKSSTVSIKYPILILIELVERPVFLENPILMEQLMNLLAIICKPIPSLVRKYNEKLESIKTVDDVDETHNRTLSPPSIPDKYLQSIVNVLSTGECSSHIFQYTISVLSRLSPLDSALDIIIERLTITANECGKQIIIDLDQLNSVLGKLKSGTELEGSSLNQFSATTSHQARLLRVLKAMDYLYTRKRNQTTNQMEKNEKAVLEIYNKLHFTALWNKLGECLSVIQEREDLLNVASSLLPLIESFMAVSKYSSSNGYIVKSQDVNPIEELFLSFTEEHKKILNILVRNNPTLMSGSFALLIRNPKILEFDNKRNYFYQQLHKRSERREHYPSLRLTVRRAHVFEDTYRELQGLTGDEIRYGKLNVEFHDEEGVDAGGVTREWFTVLARQMFDPNYALFITSAADKLTYQPNRASDVNPEHLNYFKCVGRIIGKAIHDGRLLDAYFTRSFYKLILERSVDYRDVEAVDPAYYKSLVWMLENDITDVIDLTFSAETDDFGTTKIIDLKPNGRNIPVTEENKHEYVALITEQKLVLAIKEQVHAFLEGFNDVIPRQLIQIFNEQELELLISGLPDIDIDEWKANTMYIGYSLSSPQIQWFWRAVRSFDQEERAKLLQFATGTSKVPLEGFAQLQGSNGVQKFQIHKEFGDVTRLPSAHTCFNQIDLPQYMSYEDLRSSLFKAINECSTGFAFQ